MNDTLMILHAASRSVIHLLPVILAVALLACEGPTGPEGPMGIRGPQGPSGLDGLDGEDGQQGAPGQNANITILTFNLEGGSFGGGDTLLMGIPDITQEVVDFGLVVAYVRMSPTAPSVPLPIAIPVDNGVVRMSYAYSVGLMTLTIHRDTDVDLSAVFRGALLRLAIITAAGKTHDQNFDYAWKE